MGVSASRKARGSDYSIGISTRQRPLHILLLCQKKSQKFQKNRKKKSSMPSSSSVKVKPVFYYKIA